MGGNLVNCRFRQLERLDSADVVARGQESESEGGEVSTVYIVSAPGLGRVKIGMTDGSAAARLLQLQTGSPVALELFAEINCNPSRERMLHAIFSESHVHGEWFEADAQTVLDVANGINEESMRAVMALKPRSFSRLSDILEASSVTDCFLRAMNRVDLADLILKANRVSRIEKRPAGPVGRPPLAAEYLRSEYIRIRITDYDKVELIKAASREGTTLANWIRKRLGLEAAEYQQS